RAAERGALAVPRLPAVAGTAVSPPSYLYLGLGNKEISSRRRGGGSWGQAAFSQPRMALRGHRACAPAMAVRGTAVDSRAFSAVPLMVTPGLAVLSSDCPKRVHRDIHSLCVPIVTGGTDTWRLIWAAGCFIPTAPAV